MELNYDEMVRLDAEDLAEAGIGDSYRDLLPRLKKFVQNPVQIEEIDNDLGYIVRYNGKNHVIYSLELPESDSDSWARATCIFFSLVNEQLSRSEVRFYAISGGHDLGGMFLTPEQALLSRVSLPRRTDWPYLPDLNDSWYGQYH